MNVTIPLRPVRAGVSAIAGQGLFAADRIPAGAHIIEYVGERISKAESLIRCKEQNYYIFNLDDEWDIDGIVEWNLARLINHSCEPNCETDVIDGRIWVIALRDIEPGEELSYNYGYELEDFRDHPCRCGKPSCVGYILAEDYFATVRAMAVAPAQDQPATTPSS